MIPYLLRRLWLLIGTLFAVSSLVFFFLHLVPGDPVDLILGERALAADRLRLMEALHLNESLGRQYLHFFSGLLQGSLGDSLFERRPVVTLILERYPATLQLAFSAMTMASGFSLFFGILAALRKGRLPDHLSRVLALLGISIPGFCLGPLLVLFFAVFLDWLPISGRESWGSFVLPSLTLGFAMAAILTRLVRSSMIDTLSEDFVRTARAKGLSEKKVILKHVVKNALNPVVTVAGLQFGVLLTGAIVTEKIFAWPGIGSLLIGSIERRDYPVVQGCLLFIAVTYSLVNLLTDLLYVKLDPRVDLVSQAEGSLLK